MSRIRKLHSRLIIYLVFVLACIRTVMARMLPGESPKDASTVDESAAILDPSPVQPAASSAVHPQYALQAIGVFPYVKLVPITAKSVPVPIEVVKLPANSPAGTGSALLVHRAQIPTVPMQFFRNCNCSCSCSCSCSDCSCSCSCSCCS